MLEVVYAIQAERRREACKQRLAASVPTQRTLSLGRYRVTIARDSSPRIPRTI